MAIRSLVSQRAPKFNPEALRAIAYTDERSWVVRNTYNPGVHLWWRTSMNIVDQRMADAGLRSKSARSAARQELRANPVPAASLDLDNWDKLDVVWPTRIPAIEGAR
jgi:hypothetical protein